MLEDAYYATLYQFLSEWGRRVIYLLSTAFLPRRSNSMGSIG